MLKGSTKFLIFLVVVAGVIALLWKTQWTGGLRSQAIVSSGDNASPSVALQVTNIAMKQGSTYVGITTLPPNLNRFEARDADSIVFSWDAMHADNVSFTQSTTPTNCPSSITASTKTLSDLDNTSSGKGKVVLPTFADAPAGCTLTHTITVIAKNNTNGETVSDSFEAVVKK